MRHAFESSAPSRSRRRTPPVRRAVGGFAVLLLAACASGGRASAPAGAMSPDLITAEEIERVEAQNTYDVVRKLRPTMLRPRQVSSFKAENLGALLVYVDNTRMGGIDHLRQIPPNTVAQVRYFSPSDAQLKWGSGHPAGVIEVVTRRQ